MNDSPRQFRAVSDNGSTSPLHGEGESSILSRSTKTVATCMNDDEFKLIHCKPEPLLALFNGLSLGGLAAPEREDCWVGSIPTKSTNFVVCKP